MSVKTRLRLTYLTCFSKPPEDRLVYKAIHDLQARSIVEIGIGSCQRALRMIEVAAMSRPVEEVRYAGIDLFEDRPSGDGGGLSLIEAHRTLKGTGAKVRLIPGDPYVALARSANSLLATDTVVISAGHDPDALLRAWFYLPRMLTAESRVLFDEGQSGVPSARFRPMTLAEVQRLAGADRAQRAA